MRKSLIDFAHRATLAGHVLLLIVLSLRVFGIAALSAPARGFLWVIVCVPLLVILPGLLRGSWRSSIWLCFVLLVYFMVTVAGLASVSNTIGEWLQLVLICLVFTSAMLYARWRQRELAVQGA